MALSVGPSDPTNPLRDELARTQLAMHLPAGLLRGSEDFIRRLIHGAEQAERQGAKGTDIFRSTAERVKDPTNETGIFRSPEGTWQFELSDANARINQAFQNDLFPRLNPLQGGDTGEEALRDVYNHPELLSRLPDLGGIPVQMHQPSYLPGDTFARGKAGFDESFQPFGRIATRGATMPAGRADINDPGVESHLDLLTHEIQHGVQHQTGMPRGGVEHDDTDLWGVPKYRQGGRELNTRFSGEAQAFAQKYEADGLGDYNEGMDVWRQINPYAEQMRSTGFEQGGRKGSQPGQPYQRKIDPSWTAFQNYEGLAGETQARLAAWRKMMTVPQRLEVPPFLPGLAPAEHNIMPIPNQMLRFGNTQFGLAGAGNDPAIERLLREQRYGP